MYEILYKKYSNYSKNIAYFHNQWKYQAFGKKVLEGAN